MYQRASGLLRVALLVLLLGAGLAQVLVPVYASQVGTVHPEVAYLVVPYSAAAIAFIGCGQVTLLVIWRLLSLVDGGATFTSRAVGWIDVIVACGAVAAALTATVLVHMLAYVPGGGGPMIYYLAACLTGAVATVLLVIVVRGVLQSAIADRAALEAVAAASASRPV